MTNFTSTVKKLTGRNGVPRLTVISFGGYEDYVPTILCGGTISGSKLKEVVNQTFKLELAKQILTRVEYARAPQNHPDFAKGDERERMALFRETNDHAPLEGNEIAKTIVKLLVDKYGFTYPKIDEFYIDDFHPDEKKPYWRTK